MFILETKFKRKMGQNELTLAYKVIYMIDIAKEFNKNV